MDLYFSDAFAIDPQVVEDYGALNLSVASDLPAFIDPFLIFNSVEAEYQALHQEMLNYVMYLRDKASPDIDDGLLKNLFMFKEVKQNWLGFTLFGNEGHALGPKFAKSLNAAFLSSLREFGDEDITESSHLEKLTLIQGGVGRDSISDFTTNLIKAYLLDYTQAFAREHLREDQCRTFHVRRVLFNFDTESWMTKSYYLPEWQGDFILLTPLDMLTRDETWISHSDMLRSFDQLPTALPDDQLRAQVNNYFRRKLPRRPKASDRAEAAQATFLEFPELIDYYIKMKEERGDEAVAISAKKIEALRRSMIEQVRAVIPDLEAKSAFYEKPWTSYDECLARVHEFKDYVENQDGYRLINKKGERPRIETDVQLYFGLIWCRNDFDVNREPNNGRGPVDFKVSYGSKDKSLIEFKLGSNSALKRNLEKQVEIYEKANKTHASVKVIIIYTKQDEARVKKILRELKLENTPSVVVIDARNDNKPSASTA